MAKITIPDEKTFEAEDGTRLVNAIEDAGIDILHRCGGYAKCTTCRVDFDEGEPQKMTEAEAVKLEKEDLLGEVRLACQILCGGEMTLTPLLRLSEMDGMDDPGPRTEDHITPEPTTWIDMDDSGPVAEGNLHEEE